VVVSYNSTLHQEAPHFQVFSQKAKLQCDALRKCVARWPPTQVCGAALRSRPRQGRHANVPCAHAFHAAARRSGQFPPKCHYRWHKPLDTGAGVWYSYGRADVGRLPIVSPLSVDREHNSPEQLSNSPHMVCESSHHSR